MPSDRLDQTTRLAWSWHAAFTAWQFGPFPLLILAVLVAVAAWYLWADRQLAVRGRRWPRQRTVCFLLGLVAVDLAIQSPIVRFTTTYFSADIIQHLLLMVAAAPLLALGAPSTLLLQTSSRRVKSAWLGVLKSKPFALLTFPVTVWALYFGAMFAFFLTSLIATAVTHAWLMDVWNMVFLFGATLYWWPLVGLDPIVHWRMGYGARMVNVLIGGPPEVILGLAILSAHQPIAPIYSLSSTHTGGGLLWVATEASTLIGFIPVFLQWLRADERSARRIDERAERAEQAELARQAQAAAEAPLDADQVLAAEGVPAPPPASTFSGDATEWEAYWMARTGRVPGRWKPNAPSS